MGVSRGHSNRKRDSAAIGHNVNLRSGLSSLDRIRPRSASPFFARTLAASSTARDQSSCPGRRTYRAPPGVTRQSPAWVHSVNRRCGRHRDPETGRQMSPRAAAGQHEHNRGEHRAIVHPRLPTTLRPSLRRRDQRLRQRPQLVRAPTAATSRTSQTVIMTDRPSRSNWPMYCAARSTNRSARRWMTAATSASRSRM